MPHKECRTCKHSIHRGGDWKCIRDIKRVVKTTPFSWCPLYKFWGEVKLKSKR